MNIMNSQNTIDISRRSFMAMAGGFAGIAACASMGIETGWAKNKKTIKVDDFTRTTKECDVLVIGGGMAGLFAAVKAHDAGSRVLLVSKGRVGSSGQTPFAKGIFSYDPQISRAKTEEYLAKFARSTLDSNNEFYTRQLLEDSQARVEELRQWGFFDSPLYNKSFMKPLLQRNIPVLEKVCMTHLIKEQEHIAGAAGFSVNENQLYFFHAKTVILCTGAGGFKPNGFPICDLTHDGTIMAYKIGAKVTGKEWNDGHPGRATNAAACFDGWGDMFEKKPEITGIEVHHDLGVDLNYKAYMKGSPVNMPRGGEKERAEEVLAGGPYIPQEFSGPRQPPGGDKPHKGGKPPGGKRKGDGGPPGMGGDMVGGSSAGMAIHKSEGLVPVNDKCQSTIAGLYAAGDALGSYMSGGIYAQIGSSLAGSAVQGAVAGKEAALYSQGRTLLEIDEKKIDSIATEILAPLSRESGYSPAWVTQTLQGIMIPNFILYIKKENLLLAALAYIEELHDHHLPMLKAGDLHELRLAHETANMIVSAEMKLKASIMRKESRCSHYRLDYPELDNEKWRAWINIFKDEKGNMHFEKQPFGTWPA